MRNPAQEGIDAAKQDDEDRMENSHKFFGSAGFAKWQTGGGCEAFGRNADNGMGYVLLTDSEDPSVPTNPLRSVYVGVYDTENGEEIESTIIKGWDKVVEKSYELFAKHFS